MSFITTSLALHLAAAYAQSALSTVTYGPNGLCPPPETTSVVVVVPAVYSSFIQSASQIINVFGNGATINIGNGGTTYITNTYITSTIITTITNPVSPVTTTSITGVISNTASTTSTSGSVSSGSLPTTTGSSRPTTTGLSFTTTAGIPPTSGGTTSFGPPPTIFTPILPPVATPTPPVTLVYVTVDGQGHTITVTSEQPTFTIGEGLESGTQTEIPATSPVLIAMAIPQFDKVKRQGSQPPDDALAGPPANGFSSETGGSLNNCGYAARYYISGGKLMSGNDTVGRNRTDYAVKLAAVSNNNEIATKFFFVDGLLQWESPDRGGGSFYQCDGGPLYVGFPYPPTPNCYSVILGGIAAASCPVDFTDNIPDEVQPDPTPVDTSTSSSTSPTATPDSTPPSTPTPLSTTPDEPLPPVSTPTPMTTSPGDILAHRDH
ncbi:hypothetical protein LTR84_007655 [Exophiala bonariae]|uniref:DUF7908 domain-containing protein n=1 Tax=Exophiala bonariae TaxID=1690606 RepID=A0AAV9NKP6_9EURO|nr:hypothetical protein LTR84_007655 [Exophiala bonariae]